MNWLRRGLRPQESSGDQATLAETAQGLVTGAGARGVVNRALVLSLREAGVGIALVVIAIFFCFTAPYFATQDNMLNLLVQISINTALAVGMTYVILVGGIDLSVGSIVALTTVLGAMIMTSSGLSTETSILFAVVACLGVGALCGFINGFVTEHWRIPSFIVTLGMLNIARGAAQVASNNRTINGLPQSFVDFGNIILFGIMPMIFVIAFAAVMIGWFVLRFTVFGRYIFAIGNNEEAVRLSGHNPFGYKVTAFTISGLAAGLAGLLYLLRLNVGSPISGTGYELTAIAAVIIGGTSFSGGKGSVIGTFFGACLLQVLTTGLQLMGVTDNFRLMVIGIVIVLAAIFDIYRRRMIIALKAA